MVGSVKAKVNFNPFRGKIGFANKIQIDGIRIKSSIPQLSTIANILSQSASRQRMDIQKEDSERILFEIRNASIQILDDKGKNLLSVRNLNLENSNGRDFVFKLREIYIKNLDMSDLSAYGTLGKDKNNNWELSLHSPELGKNSSLSVQQKSQKNEFSLGWYIDHIPLIIFQKLKLDKILINDFKLKGKADIAYDSDSEKIRFKSYLHSKDIFLNNKVISQNKIGPLNVSTKAVGYFDLKTSAFRIADGVLATKKESQKNLLKFGYQFESVKSITGRISTFFADLHGISCQTLIESIPNGFTDKIDTFQLKGQLSTSLETSIVNTDIETLDIRAHHTKIGCNVTAVPKKFSLQALRSSKTLTGRSDGGLTLAPVGSKGGRKIVPYDLLPSSLKVSLVASEDTGFWKHNGFEFSSIVSAIKKNLSENKISVGGSTISMQTVKNLFLSRDRTVSRKAEELFLTWYLEKYLSKKRILELYANIIEFGPGIYGAEYAAYKIFGKDIQKLTLKESIFLATLLPSPIKRFENVCNSKPSEGFYDLMHERFLRVRGLLSIPENKLREAMNQNLVFSNETKKSLKNAFLASKERMHLRRGHFVKRCRYSSRKPSAPAAPTIINKIMI